MQLQNLTDVIRFIEKETGVLPVFEMHKFTKQHVKDVNHWPGIYLLLTEDQYLLYIGASSNCLRHRLGDYFRNQTKNQLTHKYFNLIQRVAVSYLDPKSVFDVEKELIKKFKPLMNFKGIEQEKSIAKTNQQLNRLANKYKAKIRESNYEKRKMIRLAPEAHFQAKAAASIQGKSISDYVESLIRNDFQGRYNEFLNK